MTIRRQKAVHHLLMAGCAFVGATSVVQVSEAQTSSGIIMRRPLPKLATSSGTPVGTPTPGGQTGPGGVTPTPTPVPPGEDTPDPVESVCDRDSVSTADVTGVEWIEKGWKSAGDGMCGSVMQYACQATYTCSVGGATTTFTSETKDSVCGDYDGEVTYPRASDPATADGNTFLEAGRRAYSATATTMAIPQSSSDLGLAGYDFAGKGSDYGPEFSGLVQSYFATVSEEATCRQINGVLGVPGIPAYDPVGMAESCSTYRSGTLYYAKRIDNAQAARQAGYIRSLGARAGQNAAGGASTDNVTTLGMANVEKYNLITGMGLEDAAGGRRIYWLSIASPAACAEIDRTINGSRTGTALAPYSPATLGEGCGAYGLTGSAYYWKTIGANVFPDMTCTGPYQYQKISGIRTISHENQTGYVLPAKMCRGADLGAPKGTRHLVFQEDENIVMYQRPGQDGAGWASGTQYAGIRMLAMGADGNLGAYDQGGNLRWQTNTRGNPGAYAAFMSTGNLVVLSASGQQLWQSGSATYDQVDVGERDPAATASAIAPLKINAGEFVTSPNGVARLVMQTDNNFVLYINGGARWSSGTQYNGAATAVTQSNGALVLLSKDDRSVWSAGVTGVAGSRLRVRNDGNVVLVAPNGAIVWQTNTGSGAWIEGG